MFLTVKGRAEMEKKTNRKKAAVNHGKKKYNKMKVLKLAVLLVIIVIFGMSVKNILLLQSENTKLEEEKKSLESEKEVLKNELKNVNDKDYIEEQARIQLRMIKPGEIIYILQDEQKNNEEKEKN